MQYRFRLTITQPSLCYRYGRGRLLKENKKMSEHTKGPWKTIMDRNTLMVQSEDEFETWVARPIVGIPAKESKANANLIAAAPEMYEAIQAALRIKDLWCLLEDVTMEHDGEAEALSIMKSKFDAAIAKSEGRE
jgi:hypothetical protein